MFFTKVYGDVQSTKYVSYLNMLLGCVSISQDSGAFSHDSLFQISSRTISRCRLVTLPCLHICEDLW